MIEFKPIEGFPNHEINSEGCIRYCGTRSQGGRMLKQHIHNGYATIKLKRNGKNTGLSVHRLVGKAFVSGHAKGMVINHINGIKNDNGAENLEWVTPSQNQRHASDIGLSPMGERHPGSKLSNIDADHVRLWAKEGFSQRAIAVAYGMTQGRIQRIIVGKSYKPLTHNDRTSGKHAV